MLKLKTYQRTAPRPPGRNRLFFHLMLDAILCGVTDIDKNGGIPSN